MRPGTLYASASWCGALVFIATLTYAEHEAAAILAGGLVTLAMRLAAIRYELRLPTFRARTNK
jgi:uncharacterized membrane protein YeiH